MLLTKLGGSTIPIYSANRERSGIDTFAFVSNVNGATSGTQKESTISEYFQAASGKSDFGLAFNTGSDTKSFENIAANGDINADYAEFNGWYIWYNDEFVWQSN